jgi:methionyl aminopeptidase
LLCGVSYKCILTPRVESSACASIAAVNPPKPAAASGLLQGALEGEDEDGEDQNDDKVGADLKSGGQLNNSKPT